eukprot:scaffold76973_cov23-Tisochrysis_lutea.AAC.1
MPKITRQASAFLLQLSCPRRQVKLCCPFLSFPCPEKEERAKERLEDSKSAGKEGATNSSFTFVREWSQFAVIA